jgi:hypothetical protein
MKHEPRFYWISSPVALLKPATGALVYATAAFPRRSFLNAASCMIAFAYLKLIVTEISRVGSRVRDTLMQSRQRTIFY